MNLLSLIVAAHFWVLAATNDGRAEGGNGVALAPSKIGLPHPDARNGQPYVRSKKLRYRSPVEGLDTLDTENGCAYFLEMVATETAANAGKIRTPKIVDFDPTKHGKRAPFNPNLPFRIPNSGGYSFLMAPHSFKDPKRRVPPGDHLIGLETIIRIDNPPNEEESSSVSGQPSWVRGKTLGSDDNWETVRLAVPETNEIVRVPLKNAAADGNYNSYYFLLESPKREDFEARFRQFGTHDFSGQVEKIYDVLSPGSSAFYFEVSDDLHLVVVGQAMLASRKTGARPELIITTADGHHRRLGISGLKAFARLPEDYESNAPKTKVKK